MERDSRMSKTKKTGRQSRSSRMSKTGRKRGTQGERSRAGASHLSASSSRRGNGAPVDALAQVRVMLDNVDVTPRSLVSAKVREERAAASQQQGGGGGGGGGAGKGSRSGASPTASESSDMERSSQVGYQSGFTSQSEDTGDSGSEHEGAPGAEESKSGEAAAAQEESGAHAAAAAVALTEEELGAPVPIELSETATITLLHIPGKCIAQDSALHPVVSARNEVYERLCEVRRGGSDLFGNHHSQTNNFAQKNKEIMASPPATRDAGCIASIWDIYDSQRTEEGPANEDIDSVAVGSGKADQNAAESQSELAKQVDQVVMASLASPGCLLDVNQLAIDQPPERAGRRGRQKGGARGRGGGAPQQSGVSHSRHDNNSGSGTTSGVRASQSGVPSSSNHHSESSGKDASQSHLSGGPDSGSGSGSGAKGGKGGGEGGGEGGSNPKGGHRVVTSEVAEVMARKQAETIMGSNELLRCCAAVERALQQNLFHDRHLLYRDYPGAELKDDDEEEAAEAERQRQLAAQPPELAEMAALLGTEEQLEARRVRKLQPLWSFECELTRGRTVSCMAWNRANHDLLAVSYGNFDFTKQESGLVLFWSLKNPEYPERVLELRVGATALDFSSAHPNLLAVGCYDGTVAIYDMGKDANVPVLDSASSGGKHMDAVWQVKWVDRGNERGESLVSISTDGRVTMWGMSKGLDYTDLMVLKRVPNQVVGADAGGEGVISRTAAGLCFDFPLGDSAVYLAGTEDGIVHKCSCSYNEQYLETYFGHSGPVYKLRASPYLPNAFLSCSADWTVKLWDQHRQDAAHTFHSVDLTDVVHDIAWSPAHATVFGSVTGDGRIEIWDLAESTLDPYITYYPPAPAPAADAAAGGAAGEAVAGGDGDDGDDPATAGSGNEDDDNSPSGSRAPTPAAARLRAMTAASKADEPPPTIPLTSITFSLNAPVLVTGNSIGSVAVYRMHGVGPEETLTDEQQRVKLAEAMRPQNEARVS